MHRKPIRLLFVFFTLLLATSTLAEFPVPTTTISEIRGYKAFRVNTPIIIDGLDQDAAWDSAGWSLPFVDIRGEQRDSTIWEDLPIPRYETRVKMLWDSTYFYIYAWLEEPHLWATYDQHDMVIYHENDFEVFIDPDGDNHNYYELEINALGTTWDLLLTRPYRDGGHAVDSWEIPGLKKAVHLKGTLNEPSDIDEGWAVELALPWNALEECANHTGPPKSLEYWRVNFSRVQWQLDVVDGKYVKRTDPETGNSLPEDNWVWSPQGLIAMHYPEQWGWVEFSRIGPSMPLFINFSLSMKWERLLMEVYYAQKQFRGLHNRWALSFAEMNFDSLAILESAGESLELQMLGSPSGFQARLISNSPFAHHVVVDQTGRIWNDSFQDVR